LNIAKYELLTLGVWLPSPTWNETGGMSSYVPMGDTVIIDDPKTKTEQNSSRVMLTCACSCCDNVMELQIAIERFGEQPAYKIFRCENCGAVEWMPM